MSVTLADSPTCDAVAPERQRDWRYPVARWYLRPAAERLARVLAPTRVRPVHLTVCGLIAAVVAAAVVLRLPEAMPAAAGLVLVYWFFDRADGLLARRQQTASPWGAWLDGNVDELVDLGLHVAVAAALASQTAAIWPWWLLIAFLAGKYLLMYGLTLEESQGEGRGVRVQGSGVRGNTGGTDTFLRRLYHLPGNADVRVHLLVAALLSGWLAAELVLVAVYYNLRWIARYVLVARRLGGVR
ncbi:MAG: CDP-alcohol phosphatidyltransferase family protein [Candidatus Nealsonbacteria bacterium]|nr:CDP-alcohol phosphatidyltransferase family protein [Candidatus Nealsonbacteria bacterium]